MLCPNCNKDRSDYLINKRKGICYACLRKLKPKSLKYRLKQKAKRRAYFKKWYEETGRARRVTGRKKNFQKRNRKIYEMYMDLSKRNSMSALAKMFRISQPRVHKIIRNEEKRLKEHEERLLNKKSKRERI